MAANTRLSDEELNRILAEKRSALHKGTLIAVGGGVVMLLGFAWLGMFVGFCGLALLIWGIVKVSAATRDAKNGVGVQIVTAALQEVFTQVEYRPQNHLSEAVVRNTDMGFPFDVDKITGSDYVRGNYRGADIEMSDMQLINVTYTTDSKGRSRRQETTVFKGLWLICDFGKALSADLRLSERSALFGKLAIGGIKTESEAFNQRFYIQSQSQHDAFYILTPHMMEYILSMDAKGGGDTYMRFLKEGKVHIAINSGRNAFEMGSLNTDVAALRQKFVGEIRYVTDIIDQLRLVDTLHAGACGETE